MFLSKQAPFHYNWVYVNDMTSGKYLKMETGCQGNQVETFSPSPGFQAVGGEGLEVKSITHELINHAFVRESLCVCELLSRIRLFVTPWTVALRLLCPWKSPGKNTGMDCHSLL